MQEVYHLVKGLLLPERCGVSRTFFASTELVSSVSS